MATVAQLAALLLLTPHRAYPYLLVPPSQTSSSSALLVLLCPLSLVQDAPAPDPTPPLPLHHNNRTILPSLHIRIHRLLLLLLLPIMLFLLFLPSYVSS